MTAEEVITTIQIAVAKGVWEDIMESSASLKTTIEALDKQIPRRAILDTSFPSGVKWWRCPVCAQNNIETNDRFCYRCGQALDWSDNNA